MKTLKNIKTGLCIMLALCTGATTIYAQETAPAPASPPSETGPSLEIGARYMPTFSYFKLRQSDGGALTADYVIGHGFGGLVAFNINSIVAIQGELVYSAIAQKYTSQGNVREVNLQYVNIPVLLSLNTGRYRTINLNVVAGPQFGINAGSNTTKGASAGDGQDSVRTVVAVKPGDVGFAYGAGIDVGLGAAKRTRLGIGFRGVYGLLDVSDNSNNQATGEYYILDRTHIQTYSAYVGLSYLIK